MEGLSIGKLAVAGGDESPRGLKPAVPLDQAHANAESGVAEWVARHCDAVLVVNDGGRTFDWPGVVVNACDPARGVDADFALQTFHPENVLAFDADDATCEDVFRCVTVERFFYVGGDAPEAPEGWSEVAGEHGMLYVRSA